VALVTEDAATEGAATVDAVGGAVGARMRRRSGCLAPSLAV
jgi:hypothetical protein